MKTKTIKAVLSKRFNEFVETITDETVRELVKANTIITGGAIVSLLLNEKPNDYDLYFRDKKTTKAVAKYYTNQWNEAHGACLNAIGHKERLFVLDGEDVELWKVGLKTLPEIAPNYDRDIEYAEPTTVSHMITNTSAERIKVIFPSDGVVGETAPLESAISSADDLSEINAEILEGNENKGKYRPVFFTTNAISLSNNIQLIIRFYGEPDQIHENYDFEHCCCSWDSKTGKLITPNEALLAILNKDLFYRGSKYPLCSVIRTRKFLARGWKINAGQYLKMCFQISELDLQNIDVLEDQLIGVDTVYFTQVVTALRKMQLSDPNFSFNATYLSTIVDRIF